MYTVFPTATTKNKNIQKDIAKKQKDKFLKTNEQEPHEHLNRQRKSNL